MKVLLCTPFNINPRVVQGGIAIWAQNIIDYYKETDTSIEIDVVAFDRKAKKHPRSSYSFLFRAWSGIVDYWKPVFKSRKKIRKGGYDIIHLCTSASISLTKDIFLLKSANRFGVKSIIHFHFGRIPELSRQRGWEWILLERATRMADTAITMDLNSYDTLRKDGFDNVKYLPNPLSQSIIKQITREKGIVNREKNRICFVGHVIPTKGVFELVKACRGIDGIKLCIVGKVTDEIREEMERLSGGGDWMEFKGEVSHSEVIRELLSTEVFAFPTYTEGFPNVILESMACGCAIATTPVGAIPEILDFASETPCGLFSDVKDVEGLRNNILFYINKKKEAGEYVERAQKRVHEMYSISLIWEQLVQIWQ